MSTQTQGVQTIRDSRNGRVIAWGYPASRDSIERVLGAEIGDDNGRSEFCWLRLENGDLMLGTFPRGATYELVEVDAQIPPEAEYDETRASHEFRGGIDWLTIDGVRVAFFRMENGQLYVGVYTENASDDNSPDGLPYIQVCLNDADLYDLEKPQPQPEPQAPPLRQGGPYLLRCEFVPQTWVNDNAIQADPQGPTVWEAEYDEAPSEQRNYGSDALREHPSAPQWVKDWSGPFEVDFQVRFTVIGYYPDGQRFAEAYWADDANHAEEQARDSAGTDSGLRIAGVVYGLAEVAA